MQLYIYIYIHTYVHVLCTSHHMWVEDVQAISQTEKADDDGWTPLILTADGGRVEAVEMLLAAGTDKEKAVI